MRTVLGLIIDCQEKHPFDGYFPTLREREREKENFRTEITPGIEY